MERKPLWKIYNKLLLILCRMLKVFLIIYYMNFIDNIKSNKTQFIFFIILIAYIILMSILFHYNPKNIINNYGTLSIITALFGTFVIIMTMFFIKRRDSEFGQQEDNQKPGISTFLISLIYGLAIWIIPLGLIFIGYYFLKNIPALAMSSIYLLNILIILTGITLGYQFIKPYFMSSKYSKHSRFVQFIIDILLVMPCFLSDFINYVKNQYNITTKLVWIIFGIEILLILMRIFIPKLFSMMIKHDSINLLKGSVELNKETSLGTYDILNKTKNSVIKFNYKYAISCWINIDPQPPSTNVSYTEKSNLITYGGKPAILYNGLTNEIIIMAKTGKEEKVVYKTKDVPYQKWTNFIINYQGGTLDIFMDNKLVSSTPNIVPYMTFDNITIGKNNGIRGSIKDVVYFNDVLTRNKISWVYNSQK